MGYSPWGHKELDTTERLSMKAVVFPVVMYGCESWTVKKAEHRRIDAFELWCWRRLLRLQGGPTSPLELKLQYFGHLMRRVDSLEKTLML